MTVEFNDEMQRLRRAEKEAEELERTTRRMWILSMVWAALTAAALVAGLIW